MATKKEKIELLEQENLELKAQVADMALAHERDVAAANLEIEALKAELLLVHAQLNSAENAEAFSTADTPPQVGPKGDWATVGGRVYPVLERDIAFEIRDRMQKGFIRRDQTCLVIDRDGD